MKVEQMGARATMTSKGQITLPKQVRDRYNLKPGDVVEFIEQNGETVVQPRNLRAIDLIGILGPAPCSAHPSIEEMDDAIMDAVAEDDARIQREWLHGIGEDERD